MKQNIPRYYKDKIFTNKATKERRKHENQVKAVEVFNKELDRLSRLHPDPFNHYYERLQFANDTVKRKTNLNNKF